MPAGFLRSLITDGVIAGVGAVVVFLPQILILFFFILLLEASGYMARAAFLMDRMMGGVGLSGRAFIPLLSSFACAIPGIMATRTIDDPKDRLTTILIAPLMTCSARLPVYALIIAAFIPNARSVGLGIGLQGLVMFGPLCRRHRRRDGGGAGAAPFGDQGRGQRLHDGDAQISDAELARRRPRAVAARLDLPQARRHDHLYGDGGAVAAAQLPARRPGEDQVDQYSIAGQIANGLAVVVRPIGFNRDIALALIPAMAAREVAVSALATVYAIDAPRRRRTAHRARRAAAAPLAVADRARVPRLVRVRAAMHLDHRRHPARDQRLEMARLHGWPICSRWPTSRRARPIGPGGGARALVGRRDDSWQAASTRSSWSAIWGATPKSRSFQNGGKVVNLRIATSENWKDKNTGERKEKTEWHPVAIFNEGLANVAERYLRKGSKVYIEGQLQTRKWQDQSGQDKYSTEVVLQGFAA